MYRLTCPNLLTQWYFWGRQGHLATPGCPSWRYEGRGLPLWLHWPQQIIRFVVPAIYQPYYLNHGRITPVLPYKYVLSHYEWLVQPRSLGNCAGMNLCLDGFSCTRKYTLWGKQFYEDSTAILAPPWLYQARDVPGWIPRSCFFPQWTKRPYFNFTARSLTMTGYVHVNHSSKNVSRWWWLDTLWHELGSDTIFF